MKNFKITTLVLILCSPIVTNAITISNFQDKAYQISIRERGSSETCKSDRGPYVTEKTLLIEENSMIVNKKNYNGQFCMEVEVGWVIPGKHGPFNSSDECVIEILDHETVLPNDKC